MLFVLGLREGVVRRRHAVLFRPHQLLRQRHATAAVPASLGAPAAAAVTHAGKRPAGIPLGLKCDRHP
jgi:hypothetical protein